MNRYASAETAVTGAIEVAVAEAKIGEKNKVSNHEEKSAGAKNTTRTAYVGSYYNLSSAYGYDEDSDCSINYYAYKFIPETEGDYRINDSSVKFFDANGQLVPSTQVQVKKYYDDDDGYYTTTENVYHLTEGATYFVGTGEIGYAYASFTISRVAAANIVTGGAIQ